MSIAGYGSDRAFARTQVLEVVRTAVARVLEVEVSSVSEATALGPDGGADSLACVEIVELVERGLSEALGRPVRVDDHVVAEPTSVGEVAARVAAGIEGGAR
ncbi:MAG: acyl carrier protein [Actinomycetes bacterium]